MDLDIDPMPRLSRQLRFCRVWSPAGFLCVMTIAAAVTGTGWSGDELPPAPLPSNPPSRVPLSAAYAEEGTAEALLFGPLERDRETPATLSPELSAEVELLRGVVLQLDHPAYRTRCHAEERLVEGGAAAVHAILSCIGSMGTEGSHRGVRILERFLLDDDLVLADLADEALQAIKYSETPAGEQADIVLQRHGKLREERALVQIRELGGDVRPDEDGFMLDMADRLLPAGVPRVLFTRPSSIWLYPEWSGGIEGLRLFRRFAHHQGMIVYLIRGNGLTIADVQTLASVLPGATIVERGPACLGIKCGAFEPCTIQETTPGGAAEKAGLLRGDEIRAIDSVPIRSFNELINELALYDPGDVVTLTVRRGFLPEDVQVTLSHWREINTSPAP